VTILHIVSGLTRANGVSVFLGELAAEQAAAGHDVLVLVETVSDDQYPVTDPVRILSDGAKCPPGIDVVHVHGLWDPWLTRMARRFRKAGARLVWSPHGMLTPWALRNKWPKKLAGLLLYQYWALRRADLIHVTAASEIADVRRLGLGRSVVMAPLGVHLPPVEDLSRSATSSDRTRTVLFVSRVQKKKGLPNLLDAWAAIPVEVRRGWRVCIAGPDQDCHTAELTAQALRLGIGDEVDFLGPVYGVAKDALYREADIFVLPTHSENFGSVVIEALAWGTPVICTKGAPWEDLETWHCGRWVEIGVRPLSEGLRELMEQSDVKRAAMGRRGRELVARKYTWHEVYVSLQQVYERI